MTKEFDLMQLSEKGVSKFIIEQVGTSEQFKVTVEHNIRKNRKQFNKYSGTNNRWIDYTGTITVTGTKIEECLKEISDAIDYEDKTLDIYKKGQR